MAPPELLWSVYEKMGIEGLVTGYCMTETHLYGTNTTLADSREVRYNTNGRPNPDVEVEIRDPDDGTLLGVDEPGEIFMRVPHPMRGYIGEPQLTADVLDAGGWYRTGDNGVIRPDGNLILLGRVRDMIRVGGENLSGAEVEAVLGAHPAVKQTAVVPAPDRAWARSWWRSWGTEARHGRDRSGADRILPCEAANFKVPRAVHFVTQWPMTGWARCRSGACSRRLPERTVRATVYYVGRSVGLGRLSEPALLVLAALAPGSKHGYAILRDVEVHAGQHLGPGTLYGVIARLEAQGFIEPLGLRSAAAGRIAFGGGPACAGRTAGRADALPERVDGFAGG